MKKYIYLIYGLDVVLLVFKTELEKKVKIKPIAKWIFKAKFMSWADGLVYFIEYKRWIKCLPFIYILEAIYLSILYKI